MKIDIRDGEIYRNEKLLCKAGGIPWQGNRVFKAGPNLVVGQFAILDTVTGRTKRIENSFFSFPLRSSALFVSYKLVEGMESVVLSVYSGSSLKARKIVEIPEFAMESLCLGEDSAYLLEEGRDGSASRVIKVTLLKDGEDVELRDIMRGENISLLPGIHLNPWRPQMRLLDDKGQIIDIPPVSKRFEDPLPKY
ncbi:MAG: hypothetical protein U5N86_00500 [Planctomycetota bacterium]|nr:hypothetical protein [Planctomycetota bacterium]